MKEKIAKVVIVGAAAGFFWLCSLAATKFGVSADVKAWVCEPSK